jgi:hypothetical protein
MKYLWLISQNEANDYDTYDSAVVCAESEDEARSMHPAGYQTPNWVSSSWCSSPDVVKAKRIGVADKSTAIGVVVASFNAG